MFFGKHGSLTLYISKQWISLLTNMANVFTSLQIYTDYRRYELESLPP